MPLKPKLKKRIPWETIDICNKRKKLQEIAQQRDSYPTMENISKFKRAHK